MSANDEKLGSRCGTEQAVRGVWFLIYVVVPLSAAALFDGLVQVDQVAVSPPLAVLCTRGVG